MNDAKRRDLAILSAALVIVSLGFGMVIPILPFYIEELGGSGVAMGLLVATAALTELVFGPLWGGLSDRIGRKPVLMVGLLGYALSSLLFGLSTELWMLYGARALSGILSSATMASAMSYVSDSTDPEDRGGGIGFLGSAAGLGVIVGPGFGGWLGVGSLSRPFFVSAGLSCVTLVLVWALLPESHTRSRQGNPRPDVAGSSSRGLLSALSSSIGFILLLIFLASFGLANFEAVFGLYAMGRYGYGPERVGMILAVVGLVSTLGKVCTGALTRRWGDARVVRGSLLAGSIGYLVLLAARSYPAVLTATGLFVLSKTFLRPSALALASKRTVLGQGVVMGLCNSFVSLGRIVGPVWAGYAFDAKLSLPYLSGSAILFAGFAASLIWLHAEPRTAGAT